MSPAPVLERVYVAVKARLRAGHYPMGYRLEASRIADELHASMTPVRDVLNRLAGERLVQVSPGDGFFVPTLDEATIRDLLEWNGYVLLHVLRLNLPQAEETASLRYPMNTAERTADLFLRIARRQDNRELVAAIASNNDRLAPLRAVEDRIFGDVALEVTMLTDAFNLEDIKSLTSLVRSYHRRRKRKASRYVQVLKGEFARI
ncbi:GntR family transcriptional regulator [Sphingobium sp. Cam5-1]|uniref:GntR family transcriptional regulator n=1 Tax=Sphingobium sp. Cam5-1 TaxID=2789327 RepID=UPI0018AD1952|nr:GntR family transcriptional regulator [Sphingobium sp. Cam5-1]QPI73387.1 GntR family transcriptional regulator [Sphingobium sp. Cam5-1]